MAFKMKSFSQITASMINWFTGAQSFVTDLNVGSVARTLLEAVASEISEIDYRIFKAITEAQKDAVYESFDFSRKPAVAAAGTILFQRTSLSGSLITIPAGAQVAVPATSSAAEVAFEVTDTVILPASTTLASAITTTGQTSFNVTSAANIAIGDYLLCQTEQMKVTGVASNTLTVTRGAHSTTAATHINGTAIGVIMKAADVECTERGDVGNVSAGTVSKMNTPVTGILTVTNEAAFTGGENEETDDARKKRFQSYVSGLARGTKGAIEFGALTVSGVVAAKALDLDDDPALSPGFVNLYVADSSGTAPGSLITDVEDEIVNWRPAGISVTVLAPAIITVNVTATLTLSTSFDADEILAQVEQRLTDLLSALTMGEDIYLAVLYQTILDTNPIAILNANIVAPGADTTVELDEIARPGTITLTVA